MGVSSIQNQPGVTPPPSDATSAGAPVEQGQPTDRPPGYDEAIENARNRYADLLRGKKEAPAEPEAAKPAPSAPETSSVTPPCPPSEGSSEHHHGDDLISWTSEDGKLRLRGDVFGELSARGFYNQPLTNVDKGQTQTVYRGDVSLLTSMKLESDYDGLFGGVTRLDHAGIHFFLRNKDDKFGADVVGTLTHTWNDISLGEGWDNFKPTLAVSVFGSGHRFADERDLFIEPGHGALGAIVYEKASGVYAQLGAGFPENQPWDQAYYGRIGWMVPLSRLYGWVGMDDMKDALGGGPHSHGDSQTASPNSSDELWERSKIAAYYEYKRLASPDHPVFDDLGFDPKATQQSIGTFIEHRFKDHFDNGVVDAIFANAKLQVGVEYKMLNVKDDDGRLENESVKWFSPTIAYEKAFNLNNYTAMDLRLYADRSPLVVEENGSHATLKPTTTFGFSIGTSLSGKIFSKDSASST